MRVLPAQHQAHYPANDELSANCGVVGNIILKHTNLFGGFHRVGRVHVSARASEIDVPMSSYKRVCLSCSVVFYISLVLHFGQKVGRTVRLSHGHRMGNENKCTLQNVSVYRTQLAAIHIESYIYKYIYSMYRAQLIPIHAESIHTEPCRTQLILAH